MFLHHLDGRYPRQGKDSITIQDEDGQRVRLTGRIYCETWRAGQQNQRRLTLERNELEQAANNELRHLSEALNASVNAALSITEADIQKRSKTFSTSLTSTIDQIEKRCALLSGSMLKAWIGYAVLALIVTLAVFAGCWHLASGASENLKAMRSELASLAVEREELMHTIKMLSAKTWGIVLLEDKNGRFIILPSKTKINSNWTHQNRPAIRLE